MNDPEATPPLVTDRCGHLRHKGLYVTAAPDPDAQRFYDRYDATAYWCARTQSGYGPDRLPVTAHACVHGTGRRCCE